MNTIYIVLGFIVLIAVLLAVVYVTDRLGLRPTPSIPVPPTQAQIFDYYRDTYLEVANILHTCVLENYSVCGLTRPQSLMNHVKPDGIAYSDKLGILFRVWFDRGPDPSSGLDDIKYSTIPVNKMVSKLNAVFPSACVCSGLGSFNIVAAADEEGGRVSFVVAPAGEVVFNAVRR